MSFFDQGPPEDDEAEYEYEREPWREPPRGWLGGIVGTRLPLARTPDALVFAHDLEAYQDGLSLRVTVRGLGSDLRAGMDFTAITAPEWHAGVLAPAFFRFGVERADGARATNLDEVRKLPVGPPAVLSLATRFSSGGENSVAIDFWIWPLPAVGSLTLVCEWPQGSVAESRGELATVEILAAAARSRPYLCGDA